ncbi:hypothetical protein ACEE21_15275 [Clostridium baratii]
MSDDFNFYGDGSNEDEVVREVKGLTDTVSKFVYSDMSFPCICLKEDIKLPKHKWLIISKLVKQGSEGKNISVYMIRGGELFKAGSLSGLQIKAFIDIIGIENLFGYYNKDKELKGDRLYVLSC